MSEAVAIPKREGTRASRPWWPVFMYSARTAVATVTSLLVARLFRLPEAYWAPITTIVITQSSLGAALGVSWQRLAGTAVGCVLGAILASQLVPKVVALGIGVFILGLLCRGPRLGPNAYRFAGITLTIVLLVPRTGLAWLIAFHRFAEVSIFIGVALVFALVWPEREPTPSAKT